MSQQFDIGQKIRCLQRELDRRIRVYPRRVANERMQQAIADREIAIMSEILSDYKAKKELNS